MEKIMIENWVKNELGFITNGKEHFHIRNIKKVSKVSDDSIALSFFAQVLTIKYNKAEDQEKMFEWFVNQIEDYENTMIEHSNVHRSMQAAQIEIQNRMASYVIHNGCGHD